MKKLIKYIIGKTSTKSYATSLWKKKTILFDLSYWLKLEIRHCTNVMHVKKSMCDNLIDTLFKTQRKTKDEVNARLDLLEMKI